MHIDIMFIRITYYVIPFRSDFLYTQTENLSIDELLTANYFFLLFICTW